MLTIGIKTVRILLYIASIIVPFTALRFGFVGLGEILIALAMIIYLTLNHGRIKISTDLAPLVEFWSIYLLLMVFGIFFNVFVLGHPSGTYEGASFDFLSYILIFFFIVLLGDENLFKGSSPKEFFENIFLILGVTFSALYFLSLNNAQIFGFQLRYYEYFAPLVDNVHQVAMITSAMPFLMWYLAVHSCNMLKRFLCFGFGVLFVFMALESGATKAFMAIVFGIFGTFFSLCSRIKISRLKFTLQGILLGFLVVFFFLEFDYIVTFAIDFFQEADGNSARENLYAIGFEHGMKSFVFGYGPGPHIRIGNNQIFSDAHNTLITIFLQGGIFAVILFITLTYRLVKITGTNFFLFGSICAISMYMLGGDILRRLPIWLIIVGVIYLSQDTCRNTRPSNN